jgi:two-component sensor histidine kinase
MGKFLDQNELETIFNNSGEMVTILPYNRSNLPPDFQQAKQGFDKGEKYFYTINGDKMGAYSLINSINNTPLFFLQAQVPRVYNEFQTSVYYYIFLLLIMGLLNGLVIIYYLDWKIVNRLIEMSRQVLEMGKDKDLSNRLPDYGSDELGDLVNSINQMLNSMEKADAQIKTSLREKEILLREIHHRTKNNLQIIAALLEMQSDEADEPRLNELYRESQNRIHAMALVHENLYMSTNLSGIELDRYLKSLVEDLMFSYHRRDVQIELKINIQPIKLNIESAIPCGLIVTELVSNALKHAFKGFNNGKICVIGEYDDDKNVIITVADNGVGLPENITLDNPIGLGFQLVETFVEQLEGTITVNRDNGSCFIIKFKEIHYKERM